MTNRLLTPDEAAKLILADIKKGLEALPEEFREEALWETVNSMSLSIGGPGVERPKKKKNV
jgi:hypothetical protein